MLLPRSGIVGADSYGQTRGNGDGVGDGASAIEHHQHQHSPRR